MTDKTEPAYSPAEIEFLQCLMDRYSEDGGVIPLADDHVAFIDIVRSHLPKLTTTPSPSGDEVERVARAMAASDGLDWDEVCGFATDIDECDSGSCMGAMCEDHDPDLSRGMHMRLAKAAIAALKGTPA